MITSFRFKNCFSFNEQVEMILRADMRTKRFTSNIATINNGLNIIKSVAIYGPNNTGKTTFINCIRAMRDTLQNKKIHLISNIFNDDSICYEAMSFVYNKKEYTYEYKFDEKKGLYVYERMLEIKRDKYNNIEEDIIFEKDTINDKYVCSSDLGLENVLNIAATNNILIYTVQPDKFPILNKIRRILTKVANSIDIVDMNFIPIDKTIEMLKNKDSETKRIVEFIKAADLYLDDYRYEEKIHLAGDEKEVDIKVLHNQNFMDQIRLVSVYKGKSVPSIVFDSLGTRKIAALASYIITAIKYGRTLIIDELDSSLHFKITRAIFSMFNNDINKKAQLIATLHDVSLLDCKKMFRKEQIWFTDKDNDKTMLYSLKDFKYEQFKVRDTTDIRDKYSKGEFGALPDPDLISILLGDDND